MPAHFEKSFLGMSQMLPHEFGGPLALASHDSSQDLPVLGLGLFEPTASPKEPKNAGHQHARVADDLRYGGVAGLLDNEEVEISIKVFALRQFIR